MSLFTTTTTARIVPENQHTASMAVSIAVGHIFGDVPSPLVCGVLLDVTKSQKLPSGDYALTMAFLTAWMA